MLVAVAGGRLVDGDGGAQLLVAVGGGRLVDGDGDY